MSESSLPLFVPVRLRLLLKALRSPRLREKLVDLSPRRRRDTTTTGASAALETRATQAIREYLDTHAESLERAARLEKKAERLEKAGTPSESARNRAERAREEVSMNLSALRASFVEAAEGREVARSAFDQVVKALCPTFASR
ncbi:MAG: hypothetical protein M3305_16220 [Actinomycetota bacterium]|nr:hypothetical protein [Actinomycetota bacterium]